MARRSGLGKGLSALIPAELTEGPGEDTGSILVEIPVGDIDPNPNQPRVHFDEEALSELADSIRELGVLQPILVRPGEAGRYQLIAGERRWRASRRAGLGTVPAVVRATDDVTSVEQALVENIHRADLTPLEEAAAFQQLIEDFDFTHEQLATRLGKSRATITNTLRLLTLPPAIQHLLADGRLSAGHARALLGSPDRAFQEQLARRASAEGWSVRSVEDAVRARAQGSVSGEAAGDQGSGDDPAASGAGKTTTSKQATALRPPGLLELEELLAEHLATRVSVSLSGKRGRIVVEFADLEDLERIYHQMTGPAASDPTDS